MRNSRKLRVSSQPLRLLCGVLALAHGTGPVIRPPFHFLERSEASVVPAAAKSEPRRHYRYSVIAGGAWSVPELDSALRNDPIARDHYSAFDRPRVHLTVAPAAHAFYVSYRKDGAVYWTSRRLAIPAGEVLISDGRNRARARCGNRLSDTPQRPVALVEPTAGELDEEEKLLAPPPGSLRATPPSDVFPPFLRVMIAPPLPPGKTGSGSPGTGRGGVVAGDPLPLNPGPNPPSPVIVYLPEPAPAVPVLGLPLIPYTPPSTGVAGTQPSPPAGEPGGSLTTVPTESIGATGPFPGLVPVEDAPEPTPEPGSGLLIAFALLCGSRWSWKKLKYK